jgi:hypothetical protein
MYDEAGRYLVKLDPTLTSADADGESDDGDVKGKGEWALVALNIRKNDSNVQKRISSANRA